MSLKDIFKQQSKGMESLATTGTIGMHMVSGPLVGFAIGYGLDAWLETGPWLKLVFLVIGIIAGFMNVYEDTQRLLRKMSREEEQKRSSRTASPGPVRRKPPPSAGKPAAGPPRRSCATARPARKPPRAKARRPAVTTAMTDNVGTLAERY